MGGQQRMLLLLKMVPKVVPLQAICQILEFVAETRILAEIRKLRKKFFVGEKILFPMKIKMMDL